MRIFVSFSLFLLVVQAGAQQFPTLTAQESPRQESLRGLCVVSDSIVWASGTGGTFLRTLDGGRNWKGGSVAGADSLDFRDVHAFSGSRALLVSAGQPARVYLTENGGKRWEQVYEDTTGQAFFDAFAFWDDQRGLLMSDPVNGSFLLLSTSNGGRRWKRIDPSQIPEAAEGEAGFAASGSSLVTVSPQLALFGTGGPVVRVFRSTDGGKSWQAHTTSLVPETGSTGIYSLSMKDNIYGIAVGGDYSQPQAKTNHLLLTEDGGKSWAKQDHSGLGGYRSGVAYVNGTPNTYVAVGTNGMDISFDGGKSWQALSREGMHAIRFAPSGKSGWTSGPKGKIIKLEFP